MSKRHSIEVPRLQVVNFLTAPNNVRVMPNVLGVELNFPEEFADETNPISISRLTIDPNTGFERHVHPHNHVLVILEGSGQLVYDRGGEDDHLDFGAGDVFDVLGTSEHAVSAGEDGITMLSIGSPAMKLIDPERMVFLAEEHQWMVPEHFNQ